MQNTQGPYYFRLAREESYLGIYRNFKTPFKVNWSPWRKTKVLISCSLKRGICPSSEKNWPTNFTLKYLEDTGENMMHSQFCTCVFTLRVKTIQDSHEVLCKVTRATTFDWFREMMSRNVLDPDPFDQFCNSIMFQIIANFGGFENS